MSVCMLQWWWEHMDTENWDRLCGRQTSGLKNQESVSFFLFIIVYKVLQQIVTPQRFNFLMVWGRFQARSLPGKVAMENFIRSGSYTAVVVWSYVVGWTRFPHHGCITTMIRSRREEKYDASLPLSVPNWGGGCYVPELLHGNMPLKGLCHEENPVYWYKVPNYKPILYWKRMIQWMD